jgi:hypothetical protein
MAYNLSCLAKQILSVVGVLANHNLHQKQIIVAINKISFLSVVGVLANHNLHQKQFIVGLNKISFKIT